jgi:phosphatidylglycerol lysyltransferase
MAAGGPVCAEAVVDGVAEGFEADAARAGARVTWFGADARLLAVREGRRGWSTMPVGAQPVWHPAGLVARIHGKRSLRAQLNRARNKGLVVTPWSAERAERDADLHRVLGGWLSRHGLPALHFLVEPDTLGHLADRRVFVATMGDVVVGFTVLSPVPARRGWLVEQIIRAPGAPNGTSESLVEAAAASVAAEGAAYLTLGLVPLSERGADMDHRAWLRALFWWMRVHARRFYDFRGLEAFKTKFEPEQWDGLAALTSEAALTFGTLYAITDAFAGPLSPERLVARALGGAVAEESSRLRRRLSR